MSRLVWNGAENLREKKNLCWLPHIVLNRVIDYYSTEDTLHLSQSCKFMHRTMKKTNTALRGRIKALVKARRHRWRSKYELQAISPDKKTQSGNLSLISMGVGTCIKLVERTESSSYEQN